jgi:L-glyceraldehyde 3-phosphate reductase
MGTPCLIHQPNYNMFDRWIEGGLLDALRDEGIGGIVFSPLAQGMLSERYLHGVPEGSRAAKTGTALPAEALTPDRLDRIRRLNELARARGQSLAQMALAWVLRHPEVTSALIGSSTTVQIEQAVGALHRLSFESAELQSIDAILAG